MNFEGVCCLTILLIGILFVLWLTLRSSRSHTVQPRRRITRNDLVTFDALVARWIEEKRLSPEVGATIHNLIVEEFVAAGFGTPPVASAPSAPVSAPEPAPVAAAPLEASTAPLLSATPVSAPAPAPVVTTPLEASTAPLLSATPISAPEPAPVGSSPVSAQDRWSWVAALLAPSSRRALLYLGAFLLMMSSLTLVIFSWASFSPAVQFALLAGATLAIWGTGTWMTRRPNLRTAGSNLQKIAATLAPVVAFALTRPGLLDLALRPAWQLTSFLSLLIYLLIAWRTRHAFYSGATTVAALSLIFAAPEVLRLEWQFVIACSLLTVLTPLSARMRSSGAFEPATGILHVSLVAFPLLVLSHSVAYLAGWSDRLAFSTTLVLSTIFCTLRYRINQCRWWLWLAVVPPLPALVIVLGPDTALHIHALALSALALAYLGLSLAAERRLPPAAPPLWGGALTLTGGLLPLAPSVFTAELWTRLAFGLLLLAHALLYALRHQADGRRWWLWLAVVVPPPALLVALGPDATLRIYALALSALALAYLGLSLAAERRLALAAMPLLSGVLALGALTLLLAPLNLETARFALGPVAALGASWFFALERGRFAGIQRYRYEFTTGALASGYVAFTAWIGALLTATSLSSGQIGLALLPLAALAFASAYWQPGRRRVSYNVALQALGLVIALIAGGLALNESGTRLAGTLALTLIFGGQAVLRRNSLWAALSLGLGLLTIAFALDQFVAGARLLRAAALAALIMSAAYTICGERLRTTPLRYWTWPAITWGSLSGLIAAALGFVLFFFDPPFATLAILGLAGLAALHTWLWRQATLGYVAAPLMLGSALIAASQGFFTGWQPAPGDMALIICALVLGLALIGQALRRVDRAYALPYEVTAFAVLLLAPWAAAGDPVRLTLTWAAMATLYSLALWRYRRPWMLALAFGAGDLSILEGIAWLLPERAPEQDGLLLTGIVWAQALTSAWLRRRTALWRTAGTWGYVAAGLGGAGALALAAGSDTFQTLVDLALAAASNATLATVALALAALLVVLTQIERNTVAAWGSLALAIPGAWLAHTAAGLDGAWAAAWMVLELVGVCLAGWGAQRLSATLWRQVTGLGAVSAALLLAIATFGGGFAPLTFALANLGLLLATLAVRERAFGYAYGSGAAFVGAILSQMASWELRDLQWYVIPAGLYLFALAAGLRRFQGQHHVSRLIETAALALMPGTTAAQALMPGSGLGYALLLFAESLIIAAYGALARLRVPFVGGIAFFIGAVLWMTINAAQMLNQWVLLGAIGLLMVLAYVILERYQERLIQTGRAWMNQVREWQ